MPAPRSATLTLRPRCWPADQARSIIYSPHEKSVEAPGRGATELNRTVRAGPTSLGLHSSFGEDRIEILRPPEPA